MPFASLMPFASSFRQVRSRGGVPGTLRTEGMKYQVQSGEGRAVPSELDTVSAGSFGPTGFGLSTALFTPGPTPPASSICFPGFAQSGGKSAGKFLVPASDSRRHLDNNGISEEARPRSRAFFLSQAATGAAVRNSPDGRQGWADLNPVAARNSYTGKGGSKRD
jgi:hypothetical protein